MMNSLKVVALALGISSIFTACGVKEDGSQLKISNGVQYNLAPLAIQKSTVGINLGGAICSGTLIREDIVLTAAHCIDNRMSVVIGENMNSGRTVRVTGVVVHPQWRGQNTRTIVANDIAVVKLASSAVPMGAKPIALNPTNSPGRDVWIAGYGQTERGRAGGLLYADVTVQGTNRTFRGTIETARQGDRQGACPGDSGGPIYSNINGSWYVSAALSGGSGCGQGNVYSSAIYFRDFIDNAIAELGTNYPSPSPEQPTPTPEPSPKPEPSPNNPCGADCLAVEGSLGNRQMGVLGNLFYGRGVIEGYLQGPAGTDFDLYLQRRGFFGWSTVAYSEGRTSEEAVRFNGGSGTYVYRWVLRSYNGSGSFRFYTK